MYAAVSHAKVVGLACEFSFKHDRKRINNVKLYSLASCFFRSSPLMDRLTEYNCHNKTVRTTPKDKTSSISP